VTETFEMETQPQLLLLQKTMLVTEGVGRKLNPEENMWALARPLIEDWIRRHRGPEARLVNAIRGAVESAERLPALLASLEAALERDREPPRPAPPPMQVWPLWTAIIALACAVIVLAL